MLLPILVVFGVAVAVYDYTSTHTTPPAAPRSPARVVYDTRSYRPSGECLHPCRGYVRTQPVSIKTVRDKYGNEHLDISGLGDGFEEPTEHNAGIRIDE